MKTFLVSMIGSVLGVVVGFLILICILILITSIHRVKNSSEYVISRIEKYCKKHNKPIPNRLSERTLKALKDIDKKLRAGEM